jgi:1,4-dihydroxy-2-naphthoate polyprenyltransferase
LATGREWVEGARPRTLGAAIAPVVLGTAAASIDGPTRWWRGIGALAVALALQIGVNYANDYSDGVRGTDAQRRGPVRLTASGLAAPATVRRAASIAFAVAAVVGAVLALVVDWRLLLLGAVCLAAAVLYTGGPRPYGYLGLGELMVLACFGFAATAGSAYVQHRHVSGTAWLCCLVAGLPAVAILLANNIRDVETDRAAGKRTLAVRIGADRARGLYAGCMVGAVAATIVLGTRHPWALLGLAAVLFALGPIRLVAVAADARRLVHALVLTAQFQVVLAVLVSIGLWNS